MRNDYRAADGSAELVLTVLSLPRICPAIEVEVCVEQIVAKVLPEVSVNAVRSPTSRTAFTTPPVECPNSAL